MSTRRRRSADQHEGAYALEMADVTKVYEVGGVELVALDHVDLAVAYNEVVTLLGPSGSGKTTLLSIAGGLLTASTGRVVVDGRDITRASARKLTAFRRRQVGFIFQAVNLVPFLTARENLLVVAELAGRERGKAKRRADQLLDELGLARRMGNLPSQLSGGERQRVAIGRALMNEPALVLVDEPTSALDSDLGQQVMELIVSEVKARGAAAVIVTHDVRMTRYGDRVLTMADGRIAEMAPRSEWITSRRAERDEPPQSGALPATRAVGQPRAAGDVRAGAAAAALPPPRPSTRRPPRTAPPPPSQPSSRPAGGGAPGWPGGWDGVPQAGRPEPHERGPEWGDFGPLTPASTPRVDPADVARAAMTGSDMPAVPADAMPPAPRARAAPPSPPAFHAPVIRPAPAGRPERAPGAGPGVGAAPAGGPGPSRPRPDGPGAGRRGDPPAQGRGPARPDRPAGPARRPGAEGRPEFSASSGGGPGGRGGRPGGPPSRPGDAPAARAPRSRTGEDGGFGRMPDVRPGAGDESVRPYMVGDKGPLPKRRPGRGRYPGNDDRGRATGPATGPHEAARPVAGQGTWDRGAVGPPAGDPTTGRSPLPRREPGLGYTGGPHEDDAAGGARPPLPHRVPGPGGHPGRPGPASGGRRVPSTPRRPVPGPGAAGAPGPGGPPGALRPARRGPAPDAGPPPGRGVGGPPPLRRRPPPGGGPGPGLGGRSPSGGPPGGGPRPGLGGPPSGGCPGPGPDGYPGAEVGPPGPRRGPAPGSGQPRRGPAPAGGPGARPADPRGRGPMPGPDEPPPRRRPASSLPEPPDELPGWGDEGGRPDPARRRRRGDDEAGDGFWPERWRD